MTTSRATDAPPTTRIVCPTCDGAGGDGNKACPHCFGDGFIDNPNASPFKRVAKAQGPAVGGGAHRIPPTVPNAKRLKHWAGIWDAVAKDMGKQSHDYSQWNQDSMYARTPETTTDEEFTLIVYDWFVGQQKRKPLYKYRPLAWTTWIKAQMAERAFGKRIKNKQTIDQARDAVLEYLFNMGDMGNVTRALELFDAELEEVREDNKMATQPLTTNGTGGTTKPIASAPAAKTAEWYDDAARRNVFVRDFGPFCAAVKIGDETAFRQRVMGTAHAKDSPFKSWTELFTACIRTHLDDKPHDWTLINSEVTAFWSVMGQDKRPAIKAAMLKRFKTDDLAMIDMDMSRQQFQEVITATMAEPPAAEDPKRAAETEAFFAKAEGQPEPLKNILRKMYADAGITLTKGVFTRATGFDDFEECAAKTSDAEIISWCKDDIAKRAVESELSKTAPETPENDTSAIPTPKTPKSPATPQIASVETPKPDPVPQPSNVIVGNFVHPETVVVYPLHNGSIVYAGIRFSVTLRAGGTMAAAKALMDEFATCKEMIDPSCLVESSVRAEKSEYGTWFMRLTKDEKVTYEIGFNLGKDGTGAEASQPIVISTPQALEMLEATLTEKGIDVNTLKIGKKYTNIKVNPYWNIGGLMKGERADDPKAKRFKDYVRFDVTVESGELRKTGS